MKVCIVRDCESSNIRVFSEISKAVDIVRKEKELNAWNEIYCDEDLDEDNKLKNVYICFEKSDADIQHYVYFKTKEIED